MAARVQRNTRCLVLALALPLVGFSLGPGLRAEAGSARSAPAATLEAILAAIEALSTRLDSLDAKVDSLASGLRPASNGQTRLLFPAVSTIGTDTSFLFVNTGQDPSGTPGQSGDCRLDLFGTVPTPPSLLLAITVPAGQTRSMVLQSADVASFDGYAVATCDFPFAHGVYILTTSAGLATGHALVLPPTRSAAVVEALGQ